MSPLELPAQVSPISPQLLGRRRERDPGLLERDAVLREVHAVLARAHGGGGGAVLLDGHAGTGKTALLDAGAEQAGPLALHVIRAAASSLERELAFGLAGQLVRALLTDLPDLTSEVPQRLHAIAGLAAAEEEGGLGVDLTVAHGVFTLVARAAERRPLMIALDDLHWCDEPSLRCVLYLLHRITSLPVALVCSRRPGGGAPVLAELLAHARVRACWLAPLSREAVGALVAGALWPRPDPELVAACHEQTAGNPALVRELVAALSAGQDGEEPPWEVAASIVPDAVSATVRVRVAELGAEAGALARAVAILAPAAPLRQAAALANLDVRDAESAADALAAVDLFAPGEPLAFRHPIVARAVYADIPAVERTGRHLQAARLLEADGADPERVAAHLLAGRPAGDAWAVIQLRRAATVAWRRAAPDCAADYLQRALAEPPARELRVAVLIELGRAEVAVARPSAIDHLTQALQATDVPADRAQLGLALGRALTAQGLHEPAAAAYEDALGELADDADAPELRDELQTRFLATAVFVPTLYARFSGRLAQLRMRSEADLQGHAPRLMLAQAASQACIEGAAAEQVRGLCEQAWAHGRLLSDGGDDGMAWTLLATALTMSGELERCLELTEILREHARRQPLPVAAASAAFARSLPLLWQGRVSEAMTELDRARDARRHGWQRFRRAAAAVCALCLLESGEVDLAESALGDDAPLDAALDMEEIIRAHVFARVRLAQGRHEEALRLALSVGSVITATGAPGLSYAPWRTTAAEAHLALGQLEPARALALQDSELAQAGGVLHERLRTLRVLALCETGPARIALLRTAAQLADAGPPRLEAIRANIELGAALRRANRRSEAREPLLRAADHAARGGATVLYERARAELAATGARPRRDILLRGAQALTASERRIAELAAAGHSNREIAQTLVVTAKTVEYHLRNAYRKLEIEGRRELPEALGRSVPVSAVVVSVPRSRS